LGQPVDPNLEKLTSLQTSHICVDALDERAMVDSGHVCFSSSQSSNGEENPHSCCVSDSGVSVQKVTGQRSGVSENQRKTEAFEELFLCFLLLEVGI
jgi:hypothetical protein